MQIKKTLICKQNIFGGTDLLLSRYEEWLKLNNQVVECVNLNDLESLKNEVWDVVILPSSEIDQLYKLKKRKVIYKSVIIYILGMGTIRDSYYSPNRNAGIQAVFNKYLARISNQFLRDLYDNKSIVFTDVVGLFNTFKKSGIKVDLKNEDMLIPIGINIPSAQINNTNCDIPLRCCWIGRVSKDFKLKPIQSMISDLEKYNEHIKIELTIIGDGDGLEEVKKTSEHCAMNVKFINNIEYAKLGDYFKENIDLCIAMGTSSLDAAKNGIATIVISPIRECDTEDANYRWIFDSKGYSLGEYVGETNDTNQIKNELSVLLNEYMKDISIGNKCKDYSLNFEDNKVFEKLFEYDCKPLFKGFETHIKRYYYLKSAKGFIKKVIKRKK